MPSPHVKEVLEALRAPFVASKAGKPLTVHYLDTYAEEYGSGYVIHLSDNKFLSLDDLEFAKLDKGKVILGAYEFTPR